MPPHRYTARQLAKALRIVATLAEQIVSDLPDDQPADIPKLERAILEALASGEAMPAKKLARRTGYAYCSSFRACLTRMVRESKLTNGPDGYRVVAR